MNAKTPDELLQKAADGATTGKSGKSGRTLRYKWLLSPALPVIGIAALSAYAIAPKTRAHWPGWGLRWCMVVAPVLDRLIGEDEKQSAR